MTEWLHVTASRIKESTAANYAMKAEKHLIPAFGEIKCCMLKAKDIYAFIERKLKEGLPQRYEGQGQQAARCKIFERSNGK